MDPLMLADNSLENRSDDSAETVRRRDVLNLAAVSFAGVGSVVALAPLVVQMAPSADVLAQANTEIDLSKIEVGQRIKALWRKQPIFVAHLTPKEIAEAKAVPVSSLRDPQTLQDRVFPGHLPWLVVIGVCTHLGCIPVGTADGENRGKYGGWYCPCHGSQYDAAARIRQGPAPKNLYLPPYHFKSPTVVEIG